MKRKRGKKFGRCENKILINKQPTQRKQTTTAMSSNNPGVTIRVDPSSQLGQIMSGMNKSEEDSMIGSVEKALAAGEMTKAQAVERLDGFMGMWGPPGARTKTFTWLQPYRDGLSDLK